VLTIEHLHGGYEVDVLHDVSLHVASGEMVTLVGPNGAGKTTLLRTISGLIRARSGAIVFDGRTIGGLDADAIAKLGIVHVPQNRGLFREHTVEDNLRIGGWVRRREEAALRAQIDEIYERFPEIGRRRTTFAASLSGGEQQILAIAMAILARPRLLILDEPSLGLAPIIVERVFDIIARLKSEGTTTLLVEQTVQRALAVADRGYVLALGRVVASGTSGDLRENDALHHSYLGTGRN
jgi:branched-chain amino acid transport system ATP-binding protein